MAGVDAGGTHIEIGFVAVDHQVVDRDKMPTPTDGSDSVVDAIVELVSGSNETPVAIGAGIPDVVHDGEILTVSNLAHWADVDLQAALEDLLGVRTHLGNDVDVGLLREWIAGAARGADDALGVWTGTGIGGAMLLDGRPYEGSREAAGALGHVVVRPGGALCSCGRSQGLRGVRLRASGPCGGRRSAVTFVAKPVPPSPRRRRDVIDRVRRTGPVPERSPLSEPVEWRSGS